jgi:hypothetical protein
MPARKPPEEIHCASCHAPKRGHKGDLCPDGSGRSYRSDRRQNRASLSLSRKQIEVWETLLGMVRCGADIRVLARTQRVTLGEIAVLVYNAKSGMEARAADGDVTSNASDEEKSSDAYSTGLDGEHARA